jgi:hypothetical protein
MSSLIMDGIVSVDGKSNEDLLHLMYDYRPSVVKRDLEDLRINFSLEDDEKFTSQHYGGNNAYAAALAVLPTSGIILDAGSGLVFISYYNITSIKI